MNVGPGVPHGSHVALRHRLPQDDCLVAREKRVLVRWQEHHLLVSSCSVHNKDPPPTFLPRFRCNCKDWYMGTVCHLGLLCLGKSSYWLYTLRLVWQTDGRLKRRSLHLIGTQFRERLNVGYRFLKGLNTSFGKQHTHHCFVLLS